MVVVVVVGSRAVSLFMNAKKRKRDVLTERWVVWSASTGIKESDTGLAPPALWDLAADKQTLQSEQPLQVAR